jgi:hypothetical protein
MVKLALNNTKLAQSLLCPIRNNPRTRFYQQVIDSQIDEIIETWDFTTTQPKPSVSAEKTGREWSAPLFKAVFCWYSPLSKYHKNQDLLQFFLSGLKKMISTIDSNGTMQSAGLNGETWAHGWDIEGLIYGLHFCRNEIDEELHNLLHGKFTRSAEMMSNLEKVPSVIGSYGNQRLVWSLGLYLYGNILQNQNLIDQAEHYFQDAMPYVMDNSGQIIEQHGPCLHYSYTAFFYVWVNFAVRQDHSEDKRISKCLKWFRDRHTDSLYNLAGPSSRSYVEHVDTHIPDDLISAAEFVSESDTAPRDWLIEIQDKKKKRITSLELPPFEESAHGGSPLTWAILSQPKKEIKSNLENTKWNEPVITEYSSSQLLKRTPIRYIHIRQKYQTHYNYRDYLPFAGIQTWAWQDEPPIIHPTPLAPSTTRGHALDTAKQGTSHNWGGFGAGAIGIDGYLHQKDNDNALPLLAARYDWLWQLAVFTEVSTILYEFGSGGERETLWTLNRLEKTEPLIKKGVVSFNNREAKLYTDIETKPELVTLKENHEWAEGVRQLRYSCGCGITAFAFSGSEFTFNKNFSFTDETGSYKINLHPDWLTKDNPGNISIDTFQFAFGTNAVKV